MGFLVEGGEDEDEEEAAAGAAAAIEKSLREVCTTQENTEQLPSAINIWTDVRVADNAKPKACDAT